MMTQVDNVDHRVGSIEIIIVVCKNVTFVTVVIVVVVVVVKIQVGKW